MSNVLRRIARVPALGYLAGALGVCLVIVSFLPLQSHIRGTPGLLMILVVGFVASVWGYRASLFTCVLGSLGLCYFFIPPFYSFAICSQCWVTLVAFCIAALSVAHMSARVKSRAQAAERAQSEIELLYKDLQSTAARAKEADVLRRSHRLKSALLDSVTHELRTPLTSIELAVSTLLRHKKSGGNLGEAETELLDTIESEANRLDQFIGELITMARIEANHLELRPFASAADDIVSRAVEQIRSRVQCARIEVQITEDLPAVEADSQALTYVLYTLLENACKYAFPGTPIALSVSPNGNEVNFAVEDNGPGIAPELRERVFEKFYRAESGMDGNGPRKPGTGMGLSIARGVVEAHRGRIWIDDAASGQGTKVVFAIPISRWFLGSGIRSASEAV